MLTGCSTGAQASPNDSTSNGSSQRIVSSSYCGKVKS